MLNEPLNASLLREFGERLGIQNLSSGEGRCVDLQIEASDRLQIQQVEGMLLLSYVAVCDHRQDLSFMERLLMLTHPDNENPYPLQVGYLGETQVALVVRRQADELSVDEMMAIVDFLWELRQTYL